jgi:DNA-binding LacI/PurR family transcriptional regulator
LDALNLRRVFSAQKSEVVVLGFGNSALAQWAGLPSLAFDGDEAGSKAAKRLLRMLGLIGQSGKQPLNFWIEKN